MAFVTKLSAGEKIRIGDNIEIECVSGGKQYVRLAFEAPKEVKVVKVPVGHSAPPPATGRRSDRNI